MNLSFASLVERFSLLPNVLDSSSLKKLERDLLQSSLHLKAEQYSSFCLSFSTAAAIVSFLLAFAWLGLVQAFSSAVLVFALSIAIMLYFPWFLKKRRAAEIERDLPLFLREAAIDLQLKAPFERVLQDTGEGFGLLVLELKKAGAEVKRGYPVQDSLLGFSKRVDSIQVKRAVMQLNFSYEHGFENDGIKKLADELIQQQRVKSREFAAKQAFFGLLFIAASTIIPSLFSAYVMIGSSFLSLTFTATDIVVFFVFVFPLADFAILFYLSETKPKVL